jgi:hypothetical protein
VCDNCNNYFAREVEAPVLTHRSFRNLRACVGLPSKKKKIPALLATHLSSNVEVALRFENDEIHVIPERARDTTAILEGAIEDEAAGMYRFAVNFEIDPPKTIFSRFLAKIALERIYGEYLFKDPDRAQQIIFDSYFDNIRDWSRRGSNFKNWPFHERRVYPFGTVMKCPMAKDWTFAGIGQTMLITESPETYFIICVYGIEFVTNLGGPNIEGYERWLGGHNFGSALLAQQRLRVAKRGRGGYYLRRARPNESRFQRLPLRAV